jgi:Zn-dependent protease
MDLFSALIYIVILLFSIILHEIAHGYAALSLGDPTAKLQGRLTLNPVSHIDPLGSIILPGIMLLSNSPFLFGWAKPVPYNPYNLSNQRWGEAYVAAAGSIVNLLIALFFGLLLRFAPQLGLASSAFMDIGAQIVLLNLLLALFNMIPFPPLDGSKVLGALLPFPLWQRYMNFMAHIERFGAFALIGFLLLFVFVLAEPFSRLLYFFFGLITGISY